MKNVLRKLVVTPALCAAVVGLSSSFSRAAAFTPGNLVVDRVGDGSTALSGAAFAVSLVEYNTAGIASGNVVSIPTAGSANQGGITDSGSATSNGHLNRSPDGKYLTLMGYDAPVGTASVNGTTSTANNRNVARIDSSGTVLVAARLTDAFSANNPRAAVTDTGNTYYLAGNPGIRYADSSSSTATTSTAIVASGSQRVVVIATDANGNKFLLYGAQTAISSLGGTPFPTTTATGTSLGITLVDANAFVLLDRSPSVGATGLGGLDTLYVADGSSTTTSGTAILRKYEWNGSAWTAMGTATLSTSGSKLFGLTARINGSGGVDLFATTQIGSANSIVTVTDSSNGNAFGGSLSGILSVIATASANYAFRGVAFAPLAAPTVTSSAATSITTTTATLNGSVTSDGGSTITDRGFVYKTSSGVTINDNKTTVPGTTGAYTLGLSSLSINAQYFFKAYAINSAGTTLSSPELSFFTLANTPTAPTVGNPTPSSLDVAIGSGDGNPSTTTYAIHEMSLNEYVQADGSLNTTAVYQTAATWGSKTVSGLSPGTTYTFEVQALNGASVATAFGSTASGTTSASMSPTITVAPNSLSFPPTAVNSTSANQTYTVSGANLTADISLSATANFQISTSSLSGFGSSLTLAQSGGSVADTIIYVRFNPTAQQSYAGNITNTSSGATEQDVAVSGVGAFPPSVTTQPASSITTSGATLNGTVTANNGAAITDRGFYYKTSPGVTTSDTQLSEGGTTVAAFSKPVTGLGPNQIYYYRAYAVNAIGVALDTSDTSFYTLANTPTAPMLNGATPTSLNVTIGSGDGNPATTIYAIQESSSSKYVQANGVLGVSPVYQTASTWGTITVTGLNYGTLYTFQVKAQNGASTDTGFGPSASASTSFVPFTPGNLAIYRVGAGSGNEVNTGNPVFLDEYTTSGALVQSIPMPTAASGSQYPLIASGTATSEGSLNRSSDGRYLILTGYGTTNGGGTSLPSTAGTTVPRVIGRVDAAGNTDSSTALTDWGSGNNPRSAISVDGSAFWAASGNGVNYATFGSTTSTALTNQNTRVINITDGQLYVSTATSGRYISTLGVGLPTTTGQTVAGIPGSISGTSPYGFVFLTLTGGNSPDTLYVADDGTGIQKYSLVSGNWTPNGVITAASVRGLTATVNAGTVILYATTGGNSIAGGGSLYTVTDTSGYNAAPSTTTASTIATAAPNTAFRGVAFTPKGTQTIIPIAATVTKTYGDSTYSVATTASSGLTVHYSSDNPAVATVDAIGNVTITGAGTAVITASQPGNDFYLAANPVQQTLTVNPASLTITANDATKECGQTLTFAGTEFSTVGLLNSDTVTNVSLSSDGSSSGAGTGTYTINATNALGSGLGNYSIVYSNGTLTVADTLAPIITINGANPYTNIQNVPFIDPGATATDACAGTVPVTTNGSVNVAVVGAYTLTYIASDPSGNSATNSRIVRIVPAPFVSFFGVAAGDASTSEAVLWTRGLDSNAPGSVALTAQVSTNPAFSSYLSFPCSTDPAKDYTAKTVASGLTSATRYYYRFTDGTFTSLVGTFKTAPETNSPVAVSFAFSGDCDGLIRPYALASQIPAKNLDFFMFDGDTEYETSASIGSPAVTSTGNIPAPSSSGATSNQLFVDFSRKYREQFLPVNPSGQNCLQSFFAGQGNYTAYDNHELGNKQYINGGAGSGGVVGDFATGAGVDARLPVNDTNFSSLPADYMNKSGGFQTLQQVYMNYQPVKERGVINTGSDPRTDGTRQLYFAQQWGKNLLFVNVDDRTYRDIRIKINAGSGGTDDTGPRADNTNRTMLGATQLAWLKQTLLGAEQQGIPWKFVNISDPIDQIGPIGGALTLSNAPTVAEYGTLGSITNITTSAATSNARTITVASAVGLVVGQAVTGTGVPANTVISAINTDGQTFNVNNNVTVVSNASLVLTPAPSTYAPVNADAGKSWMGGYRAERNALLKFIADNRIRNVIFIATDDHQNRINELFYSPSGDTGNQSSYIRVPYCFEVVCGPLGATGPDLISNHSFALTKKLADSLANAQIAAGLEPIGLSGYPGLHDLVREGDSDAATNPQPIDFYSPDTFNYNKFDISADGKTLTVTSYGVNSTVQNAFLEYDATNNPERIIFSFKIDDQPQPTISLSNSGNNLLLSWPAGFVDYALQSTTNLVDRPWSIVNPGASNTFTAPIDPTQPGNFYRLLKQ